MRLSDLRHSYAHMLRVVFMTSFARSGETLMLRCLEAHSRISVVNQIVSGDRELPQDNALFHALREYSDTVIRRGHPLLAHRNPHPFGIILVKYGIWVHKYPHVNFVLARNPFAIVKSLKQYALSNQENEGARRKRLARWALQIDRSLVDQCRTGDETEATARLYLAKMTAPESQRLGVVRYEDFVADPAVQLKRVLEMLGLGWTPDVLNSHEAYAKGAVGHGDIDLSAPIRQTKFTPNIDLPKREFDVIASITKPALDLYGYKASNGTVSLL